jgi:AraC family transcriptional regulator
MTVRLAFPGSDAPTITLGLNRTWGGLSATVVQASRGRHFLSASINHRLLFYTTGPVPADCGCDGLRQKRLQVPGDFDVVPAGVEGWWEDKGDSEMIAVQITPALVGRSAESMALPRDRTSLSTRLGQPDPHVSFVVQALRAELESSTPAGRLYVDALGSALTTRLVQNGARTNAGVGRYGLSKSQMRRIADFVEAHLDDELTLPKIAKVAGLSVAYLTNLFRQTTGQTVHAYVMDRRVQRAKRLLLEGRFPLAEVALQCGFAHQSHLARWMRRRLGLTPSVLLREGQAKLHDRVGEDAEHYNSTIVAP